MPRAGDAFLNGAIPQTHNPLDRIDFTTFNSVFDIEAFIEQVTKFIEDFLFPIIKDLTGIDLSFLGAIFEGIDLSVPGAILGAVEGAIATAIGGIVQELIDIIVNTLTQAVSIGNPLIAVEQALAGFVGSIVAAVNAAGQAMNVGLLANSPQNPGTASNVGQINAIWAHLNPTTSGIRYVFNPSVPLAASYPGTTNPSWTAPTGYSLPTVVSGQDYVDSNVLAAGIFTGNPSGDVSDHGLITDRFHVEATLKQMGGAGQCGLFAAGHGVPALGRNVQLIVDVQAYGQSLTLWTATGVNTGGTTRISASTPFDFPGFEDGDVIAVEFDGVNTWRMFLNSAELGDPWVDSGGFITHGAGFRESGILTNISGFGTGGGPAVSLFNAYDF